MHSEAMRITLDFVDKINQGDVQGLMSMLSPDHTFIDIQGNVKEGEPQIMEAWQEYLHTYPDYQIFIHRFFNLDDGAALVGHTTGSHLGLSDVDEFQTEGIIWVSQVKGGKLTSWKLYHDTHENYERLGLNDLQEVFDPARIAVTIAKHLDLLPVESRTLDARNVREYYTRLYRNASPETMLLISEHLLNDQGYRFLPYELIFHHPGTLELLNPKQLTALGEGINEWSSMDNYAHFIVGPAWKKNIISDDLIDEWIQSPYPWQRCVALVSTIYLYGDVNRMLRYSSKMVDDKGDLIVKALAWVLQEAARYDPHAVENFLMTHEDRLNIKIKQEVQKSLQFMLKNPL